MPVVTMPIKRNVPIERYGAWDGNLSLSIHTRTDSSDFLKYDQILSYVYHVVVW